MTERIPQSVAKTVMFKAYLASDHVTEATSKTIAITISKNGGAFGNPAAGATNATEVSSGWYKVALGTGDTDTVGPLAIRGAVATIDDYGYQWEVVKATNAGFSGLPDVASGSAGGVIVQGTGTTGLSVSSGHVSNVDTLTTYTGNTVQTGDVYGRSGAANIAKTGAAVGRGTVTTGGSTTSIPTSAFSPSGAVADQFKNRVVLFDADTTTTALRGQVATISASSNSATPTFTVAAMTTAPASGDTFSVL